MGAVINLKKNNNILRNNNVFHFVISTTKAIDLEYTNW